MPLHLIKLISLFLSFCLIFEQTAFAQAIDLSHYFANSGKPVIHSDKFRPLHLRYLGYDNMGQDFKLLLDKGDTKKEDLEDKAYIEENTQTLLKYFFIGLALPNEKFWVNLRPDSPDNILDPDLEKTDIGRIFLEADVQLKKDTSSLTSPQNKEGKEYWDKLYQKAGELFGTENITIPTITRPWIVPNEIIIREAPDNAYIYKATLKVMLEEDYLTSRGGSRTAPTSATSHQQYNFKDPRLKELNEYSTQLIRETIIPKLTYQVNISKRYAPLRQVYYSLILAQWFKQKYRGKETPYSRIIDSNNLSLTYNLSLITSHSYSKDTYFQQYQKSFADGEYNLTEPVYTPHGQSIRKYMSGGMRLEEVLSVSSSILVNEKNGPMFERFTKKGNIFVPNVVSIITPDQKDNTIVFSNLDEIKKYSPLDTKKEIIIEGIDKGILQNVRNWVVKNKIVVSSKKVGIKNLLYRFIREAEIFSPDDFSKFENWVRGKRKAVSTKKIITQAIERIEYLLYPDSGFQQLINNNRRIELIKFLSFAYSITGALNRRSIDLLISRLERNALGDERKKIKAIISKAGLNLFAAEDILRIKKIIIETREKPKEFFRDYKKAIDLFIKDDNNRREKLRSKLDNLTALSDEEWENLILETSFIGSQVLYDPHRISNLSSWYPKKFGVEVELQVAPEPNSKENGFEEIRLPKSDGFKNIPEDWNLMLESLSKIETSYRIKDVGVHIHIDRSLLDNEAKQRAIVRIAKTLEAFWYRLGTEDVSKLSKVPPVSFGNFFDGILPRKPVLINFSSSKNTVEFRFFNAPYLLNKKRFDVAMLQAQIELAMQIVWIASLHPEDFTLIETGLPRLLGMDNSLITPKYVRIAIDKIYNGNPEGKINFIKLFFDKSVGRDWRREEGARWMPDDNRVRRHYEEAGLSWLYRLHNESFGWDSDMYQRIGSICNRIENNSALLNEEYKGIGQLFIWMMRRGENEKEREIGLSGLKTIYHINTELLTDLISADSEEKTLEMITSLLDDDSLAENFKKDIAVFIRDAYFKAGSINPVNAQILLKIFNKIWPLLRNMEGETEIILDMIQLVVRQNLEYTDDVKVTLIKIISTLSQDALEDIVSALILCLKDDTLSSREMIKILGQIAPFLVSSDKKGEYMSEIISYFPLNANVLDVIFKIMPGLRPAEQAEKARLLLIQIESLFYSSAFSLDAARIEYYIRRLIGLMCFFKDEKEISDKCLSLIEKLSEMNWHAVEEILSAMKIDKIKCAVLIPKDAKGKFIYSDYFYETPSTDIVASVSAESEFTVLGHMYDKLNNYVWIKLRIDQSSQSYRYPNTSYVKNGDEGWIYIDTRSTISYSIDNAIKNTSDKDIIYSEEQLKILKDIIYSEEQLKILLKRIEKYRKSSNTHSNTSLYDSYPVIFHNNLLLRNRYLDPGHNSASSSLDSPGGIDFHALPIVTEQIKGLQSLSLSPLSINPNLDLDAEWAQIQQVFNSGIRPSVQRLVEFSAAASSSSVESWRKEDVLGLIAELLRREEEDQKLTHADPVLKGLISVLESGNLQEILK